MTLIKKIRQKIDKDNSAKIYVNTLIPYFEFKNKVGKKVRLVNSCICL